MKCKNCNTDIKKGQKFCPKCGSEIKNKNSLLLVAAVIILLVVAVTLTFVFTKSRTNSSKESPLSTTVATETENKTTTQESTTSTTEKVETTAEVYHTESKYLVDDASLFTDKEKNDLIKKLDSIRNEQHFDIVIHTTNTFNGKSAMEYADDYYDYNGYGYGENHDGCILVINMDSRDWWLSTCGYGITALTDNRIDDLGNNFAPMLTSGDYYDSMMIFLNQVESYL